MARFLIYLGTVAGFYLAVGLVLVLAIDAAQRLHLLWWSKWGRREGPHARPLAPVRWV